MSLTEVAIVILAAGQATRMGKAGPHKLLSQFDDVPLVRRSAETALATEATGVIVVTGHRGEEIETSLEGLDISIVRNRDYASGMASSLKAGLAIAHRQGTGGVLVMLADMPRVTVADLRALMDAFRHMEGQAVVRSVSGGIRGNPVILPDALYNDIMALTGDIGARSVIDRCGLTVIDVEIGPLSHLDVDTPEAVIAAGGVLND